MEQQILKQLFKEHCDSVLLLDVDKERIIPIDDFLMGKLGKYVGKEGVPYTKLIEQLVTDYIDDISKPKTYESTTLSVVKKQLETKPSYTVTYQAFSEHNLKCKYKSLSYKYCGDSKRYILMDFEDVTDILSNDIDPLTGLYDSTGMSKKVNKWLAEHPNEKFRIQRYNVDRFGDYNGVYGYDAGNKMLRDFGQYMKSMDNEETFSGHLGADHFIRFCTEKCPPVEHYYYSFYKEFVNYAVKIPIRIQVGVYDLCEPNCTYDQMSYKALLALHALKEKANKGIGFYEKGMIDVELEKQELLNDFDEALKNNEFETWFQPQVNYKTGKITGAESLVRWRHPTKGLLSPATFMPLLERSGLISALDRYTIEKSCNYLKKWMDMMPDKSLVVSQNLSRVYVHNKNFVKRLTDVVRRAGVPVSSVHLEITESAYMERTEHLIEVVKQLRRTGFVVEMDDFGSAYSSLNLLKDLDIDVLKLDMKFLSGSDNNERGKIIISSIIRMANRLNLPVVAEGVETKEQADMLLSYGCELMQGYYFSKPVPADEYEKMLLS